MWFKRPPIAWFLGDMSYVWSPAPRCSVQISTCIYGSGNLPALCGSLGMWRTYINGRQHQDTSLNLNVYEWLRRPPFACFLGDVAYECMVANILRLHLKRRPFALLVASTEGVSLHINTCVRLRRPPFAWFPGVTRLYTSTATSRNVHLPSWSPAPKYISTCVYASGDLPLLVSLGRQPQAIFIRHAPSSGMCREHDH